MHTLYMSVNIIFYIIFCIIFYTYILIRKPWFFQRKIASSAHLSIINIKATPSPEFFIVAAMQTLPPHSIHTIPFSTYTVIKKIFL
jgi:hypothetical protein